MTPTEDTPSDKAAADLAARVEAIQKAANEFPNSGFFSAEDVIFLLNALSAAQAATREAVQGVELPELPPLPTFDPVWKHIMVVDGTARVAVYNGLCEMLDSYATAYAQASTRAAQERAERVEKDAARYRWLRDRANWDVLPVDRGTDAAEWKCLFHSSYGMEHEADDNLDDAIDAALKDHP